MDPPSQGLDIAGDSRKKGHGPPWQEKGKGQEDSNDEQDCRARPTRANGQRRSHAPAAGDRGGANTCRQRSFRVARKQATDGAAATVFLRYARSFGKQLHFWALKMETGIKYWLGRAVKRIGEIMLELRYERADISMAYGLAEIPWLSIRLFVDHTILSVSSHPCK